MSTQGHTMMLHTYNTQPMSLPSINVLDKILYIKVTTARLQVKSRSHHDNAHLQPTNNLPTKYQLPTP